MKKHSIYWIGYYLWFQAPTEGLGAYPLWQMRDEYCITFHLMGDVAMKKHGLQSQVSQGATLTLFLMSQGPMASDRAPLTFLWLSCKITLR